MGVCVYLIYSFVIKKLDLTLLKNGINEQFM